MCSSRVLALPSVVLLAALVATGPAALAQPAPEPAESPESPALTTLPVAELPATEPAPPAEKQPPTSATQLEEVMVTATKRERSVRKIPASINALSGADLESIGARELKDFIDQVPGLSMQDASADKARKLSIRGVGPSDGANQTTGSLIGDVSLTDPYGSFFVVDPDPFDLRTVEVLKGPQGTLFGASALNGVIRYVPNAPELGRWEGKGFAEATRVEQGGSGPTYGAAINVPMGRTAALRAAGVWQRVPGVYDVGTAQAQREDADAARKWSGRVMGRWEPGERLSLNAAYMRQSRSSDEQGFATNQEGRLERDDAPRASPTKYVFELASLETRYRFDWAQLVSVSAYQTKFTDYDLDASYTVAPELATAGIASIGGSELSDARGYMQELRLQSPAGQRRWNWLGGVYLSEYSADTLTNVYVPNTQYLTGFLELLGPLLPGLVEGATTEQGLSLANSSFHPLVARERAVFGELSAEFWDRLELTAGARLYRSDVSGDAESKGLVTTLARGGDTAPRNIGVESKGFSPKLAATLKLSRNVLLYANISRGFQFGGVNLQPTAVPGSDESHPTFDSSTLWYHEIGVRTDWFQRRLRLDVSAFLLDWKNPQVFQVAPSGLSSYVDNVGGARSQGVEGTLRLLLPIRGLSLSYAGAYIQARTTEVFTSEDGTEVPVGSEMPLSPKIQSATTLAYKREFDAWQLSGALFHSYQGHAWNDIQHDYPVFGFSSYNLNLGATATRWTLRPTLSLALTNLTDARAIVSIAGGSPETDRLSTTYNRPRTLSLRLALEF